MMSHRSLKLCLLVPLAFVAGDALAQACGSNISVAELIRSGDASLSRKTCNNAFMGTAWRNHRMPWRQWLGDFGFFKPCDPRTPLSRTFNAMYILYYSWDPANPQFWAPRNAPILQAGGYWSATRNKELWARCGPYTTIVARHYQRFWPIIKERTHLYGSFFFGSKVSGKWVGGGIQDTPIARASTLVHEATHNLKRHNAKRRCEREASCDSHWEYRGSNTYEVAWLLQFRERSRIANTRSRDWAGRLANQILLEGFSHMDPRKMAIIRANPW